MDDNSNPDISGGVRLADPSRLWPGGFVFYRFDRTFQNRNSQKKVQNMMSYIESKFDGCITFELDQKRNDFVLITADGGGKGSGTKCFSELGRVGGKQILNLDASCLRNHTIVHELVHTLGFSHEHNRPDRNLFVTVLTENILDGRQSDFTKRERGNSEWFEPGDVDTQNTPFDFQSVLLYPPSLSSLKSVSKNGEPTLKYNAPLISSWPNFAPDEEPLTVIDMVEIALAYNCPLDQQTLIQYIHYNRLSSSQKFSSMETKMAILEQTLLDLTTSAMETKSKLNRLEETAACIGNTGAVLPERKQNTSKHDTLGNLEGGNVHIKVGDLQKIFKEATMNHLDLDIEFDEGANVEDGIFMINVKYLILHTDGEVKGQLKIDNKQKDDLWRTSIQATGDSFIGDKPIIIIDGVFENEPEGTILDEPVKGVIQGTRNQQGHRVKAEFKKGNKKFIQFDSKIRLNLQSHSMVSMAKYSFLDGQMQGKLSLKYENLVFILKHTDRNRETIEFTVQLLLGENLTFEVKKNGESLWIHKCLHTDNSFTTRVTLEDGSYLHPTVTWEGELPQTKEAAVEFLLKNNIQLNF